MAMAMKRTDFPSGDRSESDDPFDGGADTTALEDAKTALAPPRSQTDEWCISATLESVGMANGWMISNIVNKYAKYVGGIDYLVRRFSHQQASPDSLIDVHVQGTRRRPINISRNSYRISGSINRRLLFKSYRNGYRD
jgi:hypothetical protein